MASEDNLIVDAATRIFQDMVEPGLINDAEAGAWPKALWDTLEESGLTLAWGDEALGGAGVDMLDGFALLKAAGQFAVPVPMAETMLAAWLLGHGGIEFPMGPMTIAPAQSETRIALGADGTLAGTARFTPYGRVAQHVAVLARRGDQPVVTLVKRADCAIVENASLAGEPSDDLAFDGVKPVAVADAPDGLDEAAVVAMGAAVRSSQMAGGLQKILDQSVEYALERSQFGRPIARFQAIQHGLAQLAGEAAAAGAAAEGGGGGGRAVARAWGRGAGGSRGGQGPGRGGGDDRRRHCPSDPRRHGLHLRAFAAPGDAAALVLARRVRQ